MEEDVKISSLSYTSKDFGTMYPEVLDLAKQLTNKWDPTHSNESDPGVVLLKEAAFVADHNNYNIDKNVLENFLPSATQDRSVRNIVEMNGYVPQYFVSATGRVSFTWNKSSDEDDTSGFTIPKFTLVVTDAENTISYTQIEDLAISVTGGLGKGSCYFMEGTLETLSVNNSNTITSENLDDNNRLYLPTQTVAQNGIFIKNVNENDYNDFWVKDNYLLTRPTGSRVYKIDFDSSVGLPYIEFPSDINNLIGDGLFIQYMLTSGLDGNISASTLVSISTPTEITTLEGDSQKIRSSESFTLYNPGAITNGKDPETINEMYNSFKKVVGTFNTLVSTKDYSNRVYSLENSNGTELISNAFVTDRRNDYNFALNVISYDEYGSYYENIGLNATNLRIIGSGTILPQSANNGDMYCNTATTPPKLQIYIDGVWSDPVETIDFGTFSQLTESMTPYDLVIYALSAFSLLDFSSYYPSTAYKNSFKPASESIIREVKTGLEEDKCICHTYKDPGSADVYCFKNYSPFYIMIDTFNKVTKKERDDILTNVYKALSENFNPRYLEFGSKLSDEEIKKIIISADPRIKAIGEYRKENNRVVALKPDGSELGITEQDSLLLIDLVSKNVLSGRVCLFDFNNGFNYKYGQMNGTIINDISTISTSAVLSFDDSSESSEGSNDYIVLNPNETVQIISPNYYSDKTYGSYVNYKYTGPTIPKNVEYTLTSQLEVSYVSNGASQSETYDIGTIVKSTFDVESTNGSIKTINSGDTISIMVLMKTKLSSSNLKCYWITNPVTPGVYTLFNSGETTKILNTNEYFIYSTQNLDEFVILGPGTKLDRSEDDTNNWTIYGNEVSIETITEKGTSTSIPWQSINFADSPMYITEMSLTTLGEGDSIKIEGSFTINNDWVLCNAPIKYIINGESKSLPVIQDFYWIKSRLDLIASKDNPQTLYGTQEVTLNGITTISSGSIIQSSPEIIALGSDDMILSSPVDFYIYNESSNPIPNLVTSIEEDGSVEYPFYYHTGTICLLPIYIKGNNSNVEIVCKISNGSSYINFTDYNYSSSSSSLVLDGNSHYSISPDTTNASGQYTLEISWTVGSEGVTNQEIIMVDQPAVANGLNNELGLTGISLSSITNRMKNLISSSDKPTLKPFYSYKLDNSIAINNPDFSSPDIMWDVNNIANEITINQIDFDYSTIDISRQMRNY